MRFNLRVTLALLLPCGLLAGDQLPMDADLPQPFEFDPQLLTEMRTHSPFNRFVSVEDTIRLTGVAYVNGKPMATLLNKDTKQRFVISDEPNPMGWRLTEATLSDEPNKTEVHVAMGADEVVLHYSEIQPPTNDAKSDKNAAAIAGKKTSTTHSRSSSGSAVDVASLLGAKGKELINGLSPSGRDKLAIILQASMAKHPERSVDENAAIAQKSYAKIVASEAKAQAGGSSKSPRSTKPSKKR